MNTKTPLAFAILTTLTLSTGSVLAEKNTTLAASTNPTKTAAITTESKGDGTKVEATKDPANANNSFVVDDGDAVINEEAIKSLNNIEIASEAITKKDIKAAQSSLDDALKELKLIKDSLPTAKIKKKLLEAKQQPDSADWTSIYQQLDQVMVFLPKSVANDTKDTKATTTQPSVETIDAVLVALQYTEIDMPVSTAISNVEKAQKALKKEKLKSASKALVEVENSIVVLQSVAEEPLYQAHLSLWQALANLEKNSEEDAKHYLDKAVSFIEQAAKSTDKATREAADKLLSESKALKDELDKGTTVSSPEHANLVDKLEHFGLITESWVERALNYADSKTGEVFKSNAVKEDLIEARFHLGKAAIDLSTLKEPTTAKSEIEKAQTYLKQSLQEKDELWTDSNIKKQVTELQSQIDGLLQLNPQQLTENSISLHAVKQDLQTAIYSL